MAVDLDFLAGSFKAEYTPNGGSLKNLGVQLDGVRIIYNSSFVPVTADRYGEARIDAIFSGVTDMQVLFTSLEMTADIRDRIFDFFTSGTHGLMRFAAGTLVNLDADSMIGSLVLTRLTGRSLGLFNVFTLRAFPLGSVEYLLSALRLRSWPVTFEVFPSNIDGSSEPTWIATT